MVIIDENFDVCKIDKYIKKVKTLRSGASPTIAWMITFKNNVYDKNKNKLDKAFLKIHLNINESEIIDIDNYLKLAIKGLSYETQIYRYIITPLVNYSICPNFIKSIGNGNMCSYDNLYDMLYGKYDKKISADKIKKKLKNNIINNILDYSSDNINFEETVKNKNEDMYDFDELKFDINLTETFENADNFHDVLRRPDIQDRNIYNILFQIFAGCYTMYLSKMVHNDLHSGNIMIRKLNKPKMLVYFINKRKYVLKVRYFVHIYDFDRAYVKRLGNNELLSIYDEFSQDNEVIENKDMMKILCSVYKYTENKSYLYNLSNDENKLNYLMKIYEDNCNFQISKKNPVKSSFFKNYNSAETILYNLGKNLSNIKIENFDDIKNNIYVCDKELFDDNGNIIKEKVLKLRNRLISQLKSEITTYRNSIKKSVKKSSPRKSKRRKIISSR
jgi:hypothetical protein